MWDRIANYILKHRVLNLVIVAILLLFLGLKAFDVRMGHNIANTLPETDTTMVVYRQFLEKYGEDGRNIFVGMYDDKLFTLEHFQDYYDICKKIREIPGVSECLSVTRVYCIKKNDSIKKFELSQVVKRRPETQEEVDSVKNEIMSLAMYDGLLFNNEKHSAMMLISLDDEYVSSIKRKDLIISLILSIFVSFPFVVRVLPPPLVVRGGGVRLTSRRGLRPWRPAAGGSGRRGSASRPRSIQGREGSPASAEAPPRAARACAPASP